MPIISADRRSLPVQVDAHGVPIASFVAVGDEARLDFKVVLVRREPSAVVAYRGSGSDEWVMNHGDKLSLAAAESHFPGLNAQLERDGLTYDG